MENEIVSDKLRKKLKKNGIPHEENITHKEACILYQKYCEVNIKSKKKDVKKIKEAKKRKKEAIIRFSKTIPQAKSEAWFEEALVRKQIKRNFFERNAYFGGYLPDYVNKDYKVIIEVDGSIHDLEHVKAHDKRKDSKYRQHGMTIIRVIAYDNDSLEACFSQLFRIIKERGPSVRVKRWYKRNNPRKVGMF